jgi:hypothetical protein
MEIVSAPVSVFGVTCESCDEYISDEIVERFMKMQLQGFNIALMCQCGMKISYMRIVNSVMTITRKMIEASNSLPN